MNAPAKPKLDLFEADLINPRTMRLDGCTIAVRPADDGSADMVIYHGGATMACAFSVEQSAVLAAALTPRAAAPGTGIAAHPPKPAPAPSGGIRPDGKTARAAAAHVARESEPRAPGWPRETGPVTAGSGGGARQPAKAGSAAGGKS